MYIGGKGKGLLLVETGIGGKGKGTLLVETGIARTVRASEISGARPDKNKNKGLCNIKCHCS